MLIILICTERKTNSYHSLASGLAFIILFTVIVREGSGNEAEFDLDIITETFSIVGIGTIISVAICVLVWPMTATKKLRYVLL